MPEIHLQERPLQQELDPWVLWISLFSSTLIFISLFTLSNIWWHTGITIVTLIALLFVSQSPLKSIINIILLVAFLSGLQIIFSPMMRALFIESWNTSFKWEDWKYLMLAVERFAWPLAVVSSFKNVLSNPIVISHLTALLMPLKWLGLRIERLQIIVVLALRFIPSLKLEWTRFSKFQTFFVTGESQKSIKQKLHYWQGVYRAMVSHTIHRAMQTGDILSIRGLPFTPGIKSSRNRLLLTLIWLGVGIVFMLLDISMVIIWLSMTLWLTMVNFAARGEAKA